MAPALTRVLSSFGMPKPTHVPHPYGHWRWIELWGGDSDEEVKYGARPHVWAFEVDEHGDDLWVRWSLTRRTQIIWRGKPFGLEEMQYLTSCEPSGDAVEVISWMTFSWGD